MAGWVVSAVPLWAELVGWTAVGFLVYFGYGYKHSALRKSNAGAARSSPQLSK